MEPLHMQGFPRVSGHAVGGLVARHLVKYLGGDARVDSLISLGHRIAGR